MTMKTNDDELAALLDAAEWLDRCATNGEQTEPEFAKVAGRIRGAVARLRAGQGQWRPIESAPRDGTKILVAVRGESTMVRWHEPAWLGAGGRCYQFDDPTHWMPPPPPPQQPDPEKQKQGREREVAESGVGRGQHGGGGES